MYPLHPFILVGSSTLTFHFSIEMAEPAVGGINGYDSAGFQHVRVLGHLIVAQKQGLR